MLFLRPVVSYAFPITERCVHENWKIGGKGVDSIEKIDGIEGRVSKEIECLVVYQV